MKDLKAITWAVGTAVTLSGVFLCMGAVFIAQAYQNSILIIGLISILAGLLTVIAVTTE